MTQTAETTPAIIAGMEISRFSIEPCVAKRSTPAKARSMAITSFINGFLCSRIQVTIRIKTGDRSCRIVPIAAELSCMQRKYANWQVLTPSSPYTMSLRRSALFDKGPATFLPYLTRQYMKRMTPASPSLSGTSHLESIPCLVKRYCPIEPDSPQHMPPAAHSSAPAVPLFIDNFFVINRYYH